MYTENRQRNYTIKYLHVRINNHYYDKVKSKYKNSKKNSQIFC